MDKTDRLRDYGLAFLLYKQGLSVCGYELIRELFIFIKLILNSYLCHAIVKAEQSNLKVGINDEGVAQLDKRNNTAISAFKQALDEHEKRINDLFTHQQKELKRIRNIEEGAYFNGSTYAWMFGLAFLSWSIIFVEITIWICITLF